MTLSKPAEDAASFGIFFALRSALRPALTYTLQNYLKMHKPDGTIERLAPSVKFDVSQRSARAVFAIYFVVSALFTMWNLNEQHKKVGGKEESLPSQNLMFNEKNDTCRRLVSQFLGFLAADTMDIVILQRKFNVFQADIMVHHLIGLVLFTYSLFARKATTLLSYVAIAELLVPCGVLLWWLKATNQSTLYLKLVRVLGLVVLSCVRFPLFTWALRCMWLSRTQSLFPVDDKRTAAVNAEKNKEDTAESKESLIRKVVMKDSMLDMLLSGKKTQSLPTTVVFTLATMCGLGLDYRWTKLYLDGLFTK
eukprot:CAMPEP_0177646862 /NCGR_PEP_ID=MMETSP0447-20121125/9994_1 /TAXON_ID=0 /ORGANISM="Stygamoeba regulata, Strain BSH-02190019" /LENGTH=307 /DNA_ID=CAMNT_0019149411 /DNA_START=135 /DNA_END=1058 /DNA_ORIENTATION=-